MAMTDQEAERSLNLVIAQTNAETSVTLTGIQWRALSEVAALFKPGNDGRRKYLSETARAAIPAISAAVEITNERLANSGGTKARCPECSRVFDLSDADQANEWYYGHDCES